MEVKLVPKIMFIWRNRENIAS